MSQSERAEGLGQAAQLQPVYDPATRWEVEPRQEGEIDLATATPYREIGAEHAIGYGANAETLYRGADGRWVRVEHSCDPGEPDFWGSISPATAWLWLAANGHRGAVAQHLGMIEDGCAAVADDRRVHQLPTGVAMEVDRRIERGEPVTVADMERWLSEAGIPAPAGSPAEALAAQIMREQVPNGGGAGLLVVDESWTVARQLAQPAAGEGPGGWFRRWLSRHAPTD